VDVRVPGETACRQPLALAPFQNLSKTVLTFWPPYCQNVCVLLDHSRREWSYLQPGMPVRSDCEQGVVVAVCPVADAAGS
jgi:hypothetical protein